MRAEAPTERFRLRLRQLQDQLDAGAEAFSLVATGRDPHPLDTPAGPGAN